MAYEMLSVKLAFKVRLQTGEFKTGVAPKAEDL